MKMISSKFNSRLIANQDGAMSLFTVIILAVILSTITLGLLRISIQDARQSIDDDLSNRAFFAAESGLNDAIRFLHEERTAGPTPPGGLNGDICDVPAVHTGINDISSDVDGDSTPDIDAEYTCQLITTKPASVINTVNQSGTVQVPLNFAGSITPTGVVLRWHNSTDGVVSATFRNTKDLPAKADWNAGGDPFPAMIQTSLFWTPAGTPFSRNDINSTSVVNYYNPANVGESSNQSTNGQIVDGECSAANFTASGYYCEATIDISNLDTRNYVLRLSPMYRDSTMDVSFVGGYGFEDVQARVDVTGRAGDVFRRVQASVSLNESNRLLPNGAVNSMEDICKRLNVVPAPASIVNGCDGTGFGIVPDGDGFAPVEADGQIYNMFHHNEEAAIICHNPDLSACGVARIPGYLTSYHSNLVVESSGPNKRMYFTARRMPLSPSSDFGIGCYDYDAKNFCGFTTLGSTNFVSSLPVPAPTNNNNGAIGPLVEVNNKYYTVAIDSSGTQRIYCGEIVSGSMSPCVGFAPYDIGLPAMANGTLDQLVTSFNVLGDNIIFYVNNTNPSYGFHFGCFDTNSANKCGGWPTKTVATSAGNTGSVLVGNTVCAVNANVAVDPTLTNFTLGCYNANNGSVAAQPPGFMTQPMPATAVNGRWWGVFDPHYENSKIYWSGFNFGSDGGATYCYDRNISNVCAGWGGDNGWQNGSSVGNDFSQFLIYDVVEYNGCLYGSGDRPSAAPLGMMSFSATDASPCTP